MMAETTSSWEKAEILIYKFISLFPVFVTFGLYTYLFGFYVVVSFRDVLITSIVIVVYLPQFGRKFWYLPWNSKFMD